MRTVKFKAFDRISKEMHPWEIINSIDLNSFLSLEHYTLFQFTGFKDCKDRDIYEGDILSDWNEVDGKQKQSKQQVFWCEKYGQWRLDTSFPQDKSNSYPLYKELRDFDYEVTANIYELPSN